MKFKKISLISLTVISMFSMNVAPIFAGHTKLTEKSKVTKESCSSRARDKKPRSEVDKSEKVKTEIWFCKKCGCHLGSQDTLCKNEICVLFREVPDFNCSTGIKCLKSDIEKKKASFPECEVCGSHDVKLTLKNEGLEIFCYNCRDTDDRSNTESASQNFSSNSEENLFKLTVKNVKRISSGYKYFWNQRQKVRNWTKKTASIDAMYPHPLTFLNLNDLPMN